MDKGNEKNHKRTQIPLIIDEVQTGIGRTGKMFAFEHAGIIPDVIVLSKAIGGSLPLSVVVYDRDLDQWAPGAHIGTFRGNQMAMAAGTATLKYMKENGILLHVEKAGAKFMRHLQDIQRHIPEIGDVRGRGLMIGAEIVSRSKTKAAGTPPADPELGKERSKENALKKA